MLIILLISFKLEGQYQFDFEIDSSGVEGCCSQGVWRQVPERRWCCHTMDPLVGASSLHHCYDNSKEDCDFLVLWCDRLNTADPFSVSFRIRHGFDPSSMNNWQLVLGASFSDGQGTVLGEPHLQGGLVLGVNFTGSDDHIKIWHVDGARVDILLSTSLNYQEEVGTWQAPQFLLEGDGEGKLTLWWSPDPEIVAPVLLGSCGIGHIWWDRQVLLRYQYTSARDRALWLDDLILEGNFEKDSIAPVLKTVKLLNARTFQLEFSETVELSEASTFILLSESDPEGVNPDSLWAADRGFVLTFPEKIPNRVPQKLQIQAVADPDGNLLEDTLVMVIRNEARWGDLVFNELMADPDPAVRHSEEYLELYNRSEYPVNPEGWMLKVNDRSYVLLSSHVENEEGSNYFLIRGITLPNDGAVLSLYSKEGTLIHAATYEIPWDGPHWKKQGGWALESPQADQVCQISANWVYSEDPGGGTPGRSNSTRSVLVDNEPPVLLYAGLGDSGADDSGAGDPGVLLLHYSEPLRLSQDVFPGIFLNPEGIVPDSVRLLEPLQNILQVYFPVYFQSLAYFQLNLSGVGDCAGNLSDNQVLSSGAPFQPAYASVLINEIMFDPEEGKSAFVELFLPGDRSIDLLDLSLHLVEEDGSPDHPLVLSPHSRLFLPGQYLVLTECVPQLQEAYGLELTGQWVELDGLSGLKGSSGSIFLTDRSGQVVDHAKYSDEMHMELLDDPRGISLERISAVASGSDPDNWHSAASIAGYATPGRENSQSAIVSDSELLLEVLPEVFSPDNDGYEDLMKISVSTSGNDWIIGLVITDLHGNRIRVLANNHLAAPSAAYTWDGEGENGVMQPMGFYVIHARGYRPATGEQWVRRRAVGLMYR